MAISHNRIAQLVEKIKQSRDSQAFAELYQLTYQRIYFNARSIIKDEHETQDAVQEIYMKILSSIDELKDNKLFIAWANKLAYHVCLRYLSKLRDMTMSEGYFDDLTDDEATSNPLIETMEKERHRELMKAIFALPVEIRATLLFKYFDGMKIKEIAHIMECPEGTVKSRLHTAKKLLRETLGRGEVGGDANV